MTTIRAGLVALVLGLFVGQAQAAPLQLSYTITTQQGSPEIQALVFFNTYQDGGTGAWWSSSAAGNGLTTTVVDPFFKDTDNRPLEGLILGLASDFPGDAPGQKHVVLIQSVLASQKLSNIAWGAAFPTVLEDNLVANLERAIVIGDGGSGGYDPDFEAALDALFSFVSGPARNVPNMGPFGSPGSIWFGMGQAFSVMAFSDGQVIGEGFSEVTDVSTVPAPAALPLLFTALGGLGLYRRRRR